MPAEQKHPTFVDGIGPPLEQLREDYISFMQISDQETAQAASDVLALIGGYFALQAELQAAQERETKLNRSIVAHHNIANLSDEAIREGFGAPGGCPICAAAQRTESATTEEPSE